MAKRADSKSYDRSRVEVQKGPISMDEQYSNNFRREPESTMRDIENNKMRQEKMTLTLHTPKQ
jgi:hypothetical protein